METTKIVIRPFASKKGSMSLFFCSLIGMVVLIFAVFLTLLTGEKEILLIMGIMAAVFILLGVILFLIFPRVKIVFDAISQNATIHSNKSPQKVVPFYSLQPFQIYEVLRGYSHQYYCRNMSFGDYSDLFFSARHVSTLKKAKKLNKLTGGTLIDINGRNIQAE